jgi:hypothetical protein
VQLGQPGQRLGQDLRFDLGRDHELYAEFSST